MTANCKTCGKPPLANRAGSVTSYFFQHNYCQCHSADDVEDGSEGFSGKSDAVRRPVSSSASSSAASSASSRAADNGDQVCANCGKSRPTNRRAGSFTAFLFKELRCTCAGPTAKPVAAPAKGGRRPTVRSRTAARVAQRKQFTESYRESKVSGDANVSSAFKPGAVIGGAFRIDSMIGQGGMGVVYLAEQTSLRKQVALKILAPELVNEQSWRRFQAEAKILAPLNHNALVKVYDLGIHDQTIPYYSMDFLEGQSIEEILTDDGPLSLKQTLAIFVEVLDGLAYAHRNGIIHRDIKPGNIMICTTNGVRSAKILDFGISKLVGQNAASSQSLTAVGEIFGSPFYMSPEQCAGTTVDARSDIYSVGCTLIEALTGFVPFEGDGFLETVLMHQEEEPPLLSDLNPDLKYPPSLDQVLAKSLAKQPIDRYQSAKEMSLDLVRVLEGKAVSAQPERSKYIPPAAAGARRPVASKAAKRSIKLADSPATSLVLPISLAVCAILGLTGVFAFMILGPTDKGVSLPQRKPRTADLAAIEKPPEASSGAGVTSDSESSSAGSASEAGSANTASSGVDSTGSSSAPIANDVSSRKTDIEASNESMFAPIEDSYGLTKEPTGSEKETAPFSTIIVEGDKRLRRFEFPIDTVIGKISYSNGDGLQPATGVVILESDKQLAFVPSGIVSQYPQYMKRFRDGEVKAVFLIPSLAGDSICEAIANIPGVTELHINDSKGLSLKGLKALEKFKKLHSVYITGSELTGAQLASVDCWKELTKFSWRNAIEPGPFLEKLQLSNQLTWLNLSARTLKHSDFELIAKLTNLQSLTLPSNSMTVEDLAVVATLPKLSALDIHSSGLGARVIPILSKMPSLKELKILQAFSSTELKTKLINQLPRVRVYNWSDVN